MSTVRSWAAGVVSTVLECRTAKSISSNNWATGSQVNQQGSDARRGGAICASCRARKCNAECATRPHLRGDAGISAVGLSQVLDDGQSQPGATLGARTRAVDTIEALEDARQVLGRDAAPGILHLERHHR